MLMGERSVWPDGEPRSRGVRGTERAVVGLVLVGHSAEVVRGVTAMVAQAAPGVPVAGAGGLSGGRLGTNAHRGRGGAAGGARRHGDDGVVVLLDLGSACDGARTWRSTSWRPRTRDRVRV